MGGDVTTGAPTTGAASTMPPGTDGAAGMDVLILRTASSIEELAVAAYQTAIDSGLVTTAAIADAAMLFQAQHREHSGLFQSLTTRAGGEPFTMPNPAILEAIQPMIDVLKDEMGVVAVAPARGEQGAAQDRDAADLEGPPAADAEDEVLSLIGAERVGTLEDPGEQLAQPGERLLVVDL